MHILLRALHCGRNDSRSILLLVLLAQGDLNGRALLDALDPGLKVGQLVELLLLDAGPLGDAGPGEGADVGDRVGSLAVASEVLLLLARVAAAQLDLDDVQQAEGFVVVALCPVGSVFDPSVKKRSLMA
jgi:hypothetical protein